MLILLLVLATALPFLYTMLNLSTRTVQRIDTVEQARSAMRLLTRELRQASLILDQPGNNRGSSATQITFTVDLNDDGAITACDAVAPPECFVYTLQDGNIYRYPKQKGPGTALGNLLVRGPTTLSFRYFGNDPVCDTNQNGILNAAELDAAPCGNGNGVVNLLEFNRVNRVLITITVTQRDQTQTLTSDVTLRNLNRLINPQ